MISHPLAHKGQTNWAAHSRIRSMNVSSSEKHLGLHLLPRSRAKNKRDSLANLVEWIEICQDVLLHSPNRQGLSAANLQVFTKEMQPSCGRLDTAFEDSGWRCAECKSRFHKLRFKWKPELLWEYEWLQWVGNRTWLVAKLLEFSLRSNTPVAEQYEKAKNIAIAYLSKRMASEKRLREKLKERGVESCAAIDKTICLMKEIVSSTALKFCCLIHARNCWMTLNMLPHLPRANGVCPSGHSVRFKT